MEMEKEVKAVATVIGERTQGHSAVESGPRAYYLRHRADTKNWSPVMAQIHDHTMVVAGVPASRFYHDATSFVDAQVAVQSYYGLDELEFINDAYNFEAEALGARMIYGKESMPTIDFREPLIKKPADLLRLSTPDFRKDGRFPYQMEIGRQSMELGINTAFFCGPFSLAVGVRSYPLLIQDTRKDPGFVHDLFTFLVDHVLLPYIRYMHDQLGVTVFSGADAWSAFPNLSPGLIEELVLPWNLRILQKGAEMGVYAAVVATADYCEERIEKFDAGILRRCLEASVASQGAPVILLGMGRWQDYPLEPVVEYGRELKAQGQTVTVMAGVNARLLRDGPVPAIVRNVKRLVDAFTPEFNLIIFLANIPADAPGEHIHAAVQAARHYSQAPYRFRDDGASFVPGPAMSFTGFMSRIDSL